MEDADFFTKEQNLITEKNHANPSKSYTHFIQKALIVTIFFVTLPLFPSQSPEFINQTLLNRSWELLHLLIVGIAVSYGLFSRRIDETEENHNNVSKFDNAQSYVSRLLHVSFVFDDNADDASGSDHNKVQTWGSHYHRDEPPMVVAADPSVYLDKQKSYVSWIGEKPLLLPVRRLKSHALDADEIGKKSINPRSMRRSNSTLGCRRDSNKRNNGELGGLDHWNLEDNEDENVAVPSPIPWQSRSGRMEVKEETLPSSMEESNFNGFESRSLRSRSSRSNSTSSSPKLSPSPSMCSPQKLSPLPFLSAESQAKSTEDFVKKKSHYRSSPPLPPVALKLSSMKPSSKNDYGVSFGSNLHGNFRSEPNKDLNFTEGELLINRVNSGYVQSLSMGKSIRTIRAKQLNRESVTFMPRPTYTEFPQEEKQEFVKKVMVETEIEGDSETEEEDAAQEEGSFVSNLGMGTSSSNHEKDTASSADMDAASDVDKKADEFIAKIREQIRLQRIDSIKRSSRQIRRNSSR